MAVVRGGREGARDPQLPVRSAAGAARRDGGVPNFYSTDANGFDEHSVELAKGIIMREQGCPADEAFDTLVRMSQQRHMKLRDLAQLLVDEVGGGKSLSATGE